VSLDPGRSRTMTENEVALSHREGEDVRSLHIHYDRDRPARITVPVGLNVERRERKGGVGLFQTDDGS
jgi:hypothetical protein